MRPIVGPVLLILRLGLAFGRRMTGREGMILAALLLRSVRSLRWVRPGRIILLCRLLGIVVLLLRRVRSILRALDSSFQP